MDKSDQSIKFGHFLLMEFFFFAKATLEITGLVKHISLV